MAIKEVVKYEGDNTTFVWKHPKEDFNTNSQLIVHEINQGNIRNFGFCIQAQG